MKLRGFPAALVALGLALTPGDRVRAQESEFALPDLRDFTLDRDLSDYRTFAWNRSQMPAANMANHLRIINAIQDQMKEHGYRIDPVDPEVRIQYRLEVHDRVKGRTTQERSVWDNANATVKIDFDKETLAEFGLRFVDAESNIVVWETKGTYVLGTPDRAEKQIKDAVVDLFESYPSKK